MNAVRCFAQDGVAWVMYPFYMSLTLCRHEAGLWSIEVVVWVYMDECLTKSNAMSLATNFNLVHAPQRKHVSLSKTSINSYAASIEISVGVPLIAQG